MSTPFAPPDDPILSRSATALARAVRSGELRSEELVERCIARIQATNPALGAFVSVFERAALREARRLDRLGAAGRWVGPFHGVPTGVKDMHPVRGTRLRMGSRAYRYLVAPYDDGLVRSLRGAGFVLLGKTGNSELSLLPVCETDLHPPVRNPWDPSRTAGGSSGGAGAAVASGMVPIAPGSDGAGSVRIPSALCGLAGIKPSRGLVPDDVARIDTRAITALGPMARGVDDAAALLDVMAGATHRFAEAATVAPGPLRVGLILQPPFGETHPQIAAAVEAAARWLEGAGHRVVPLPRVTGTLEEFLPIYQDLFSRVPVLLPSRLQPVTRWFREQGLALDRSMVEARLRDVAARGEAAIEGVDVLLTPTVPIVPPRVGQHAHLGPAELFAALAPLGSFTAVSNVTGAPALTVPCGVVEAVPVGAQLIARPGQDGLLLGLGRVLERAVDGR